MEEHRPGGHGGGGEEGGEGAEGVEEEETFADEGEGGDGDGEAGEGRAEGEGEGGEGEEVDVCLECVLHAFLDPVVSDARTSGGGTHEELVSAFAAVDNPGKHLQREHRLRGGGAFRGGEVPRGGRRGGLWGLPLEPRCVECCCRAYAQLHRLPCVRESILLARRPPRVRRRRGRRERRRREMRHRLGREWRIEKKRTNNNNRSRLAISRLSLSHRGDLSPSLHPTSLFLSSSHPLSYILTMPAPPTRTNSPASSSTSKPIFPADQLRAWIRPLLATTLRDVVYDHADPGRMKELSRGLSEVCALSCPLFA